MARQLAVLGVPIDSVGDEGGTELGPAALREHLGGWPGPDTGDTLRKIRGTERAANGWLAFDDCLAVTTEVRERVAEIVEDGNVPLVLGGCCTLLPGALAGARDAIGEFGLAYLDGHLDLFTGETSPTGEGADMPVATLLGDAPPELLDRLGVVPVVPPGRVTLIGARDEDEERMVGHRAAELGIGDVIRFSDLEGHDPAEVGHRIEGCLTEEGNRFWLHLDVDVLGEEELPATDYLMPGGLDLDGLRRLLGPLAGSPGLLGVNITCFNPEKDPDGRYGRQLASVLREVLERGSSRTAGNASKGLP